MVKYFGSNNRYSFQFSMLSPTKLLEKSSIQSLSHLGFQAVKGAAQ